MLKLTIKNPKGEISTFDLAEQFYAMREKYQESGVKVSVFDLTYGDMQKEDAPIRLSSDSDMGQAVLRLLKPNDTLYEAHLLDETLTHVRDEIKEDLENYIVNEQYSDQQELYDGIREMAKEFAEMKISFYCPLVGQMNDHDGDEYDVGEYTLADNSYAIEEKLKTEQSNEVRLGEYVGEHANVSEKLMFAEWNVEEFDGALYGRIDCYLSEELTEEETKRLKEAIIGQNSDGFGENFEQRGIPVDEGELFVSFWNSNKGYFLYTQDEMEEYLGHSNGMKFGGG